MTDVPSGNDPWSSPSQNQPPPNYGAPPPGNYAPPGAGGGYGQPAPQTSNGVGIAALVVGIVSLFVWWIPFLGLVVAVVAVVLGIVGIRKASRGAASNKGMAIAGLVTGALGLVASLIITIFFVGIFSSDSFQNILECTQNAQTVEEQRACQEEFEQDFGQ